MINRSLLFRRSWMFARAWAKRDGTKIRNEFRRALKATWAELRPGTPAAALIDEVAKIRAEMQAAKAAGKIGRYHSYKPWRFANSRF